MSDINDVRKRYAPYLIRENFLRSSKKRLWACDGKFYLITFELASCNLGGFFTNLGINFLWNKPCGGFEFYYPELRITSDNINHFSDAILYESPDFEVAVHETMQQLLLRINDYKKLNNLDYLSDRLRNRRDLFWSCNQNDCNMADFDLGVVQMLRGHIDEARAIFQYNYDLPDGSAKECLQYCDSVESFKGYITQKVIENRALYAAKYRYRLPVIDEIFKTHMAPDEF